MKKQFSFVCIAAVLFSSCAKQKPSEEFTNVEVYETGTNMPVEGARVKLSRCTKYDFEFGCQAVGVFASYSTNSDGVARIKNEDYNKADEGIMIEKSGYWPQAGGQGRNEISAEGWITANIKRVNTYPDDKRFYLFVADEKHLVTTGIKVAEVLQHDTTVTFKAFGAQANEIKWIVGQELLMPGWNDFYITYDIFAEKSLVPVTVSKTGTTTINIEY